MAYETSWSMMYMDEKYDDDGNIIENIGPWEASGIGHYFETEFYPEAFAKEEQSMIIPTEQKDPIHAYDMDEGICWSSILI